MNDTTHNNQNSERENLLRLAGLDALGQLDQNEQHQFQIGLKHASPDLKEEVKEVQNSILSDIRDSLPDVTPDQSLRKRVLHAVSRCIARDFEQSVQTTTAKNYDLPAFRKDWFERFVAGRVSPVWRVAALILITVLVGVMFYNMDVRRRFSDAMIGFRNNEVDQVLEKEFGHTAKDFMLDANAIHVAMNSTNDSFGGRALISYLPDDKQGIMFAENLPTMDQEYILQVQTMDGSDAVVLVSFESNGGVVAIDFDIPQNIDLNQATFALLAPQEDGKYETILQSWT